LMKSPLARQYLGTPPISLKVAYYQGRKQARLSQVHLHSWSVSALRPCIMLTAASLPQRLCWISPGLLGLPNRQSPHCVGTSGTPFLNWRGGPSGCHRRWRSSSLQRWKQLSSAAVQVLITLFEPLGPSPSWSARTRGPWLHHQCWEANECWFNWRVAAQEYCHPAPKWFEDEDWILNSSLETLHWFQEAIGSIP
jgi:hypothetical protein